MRLKFIHIALLFGFLGLAAFANAQESTFSEHHDETPNYYLEEDSSPSKNQTQKEVTVPSNNSTEVQADDKDKNEDVLSFNFLYYIIQRYKMGDIVEQKK